MPDAALIELLLALDEPNPPAPFELLTESVTFGEPVLFRYEVMDAPPPCLEIAAIGPDGQARLLRPDRPRPTAGFGNISLRGPERVVQDWVAIDEPGTWTLQVVHRGLGCKDSEPTRTALTVEVLPSEEPVTAGSASWTAAAIPSHRDVLIRLAQAGVPGGAHALAGIPDRAATDALITLLDHPVAGVARAAADGLSTRVPRPQMPDDAAWSEATWRAEHLPAVSAWLERTAAPARATERLRRSVDCVVAPTEDCAWRR